MSLKFKKLKATIEKRNSVELALDLGEYTNFFETMTNDLDRISTSTESLGISYAQENMASTIFNKIVEYLKKAYDFVQKWINKAINSVQKVHENAKKLFMDMLRKLKHVMGDDLPDLFVEAFDNTSYTGYIFTDENATGFLQRYSSLEEVKTHTGYANNTIWNTTNNAIADDFVRGLSTAHQSTNGFDTLVGDTNAKLEDVIVKMVDAVSDRVPAPGSYSVVKNEYVNHLRVSGVKFKDLIKDKANRSADDYLKVIDFNIEINKGLLEVVHDVEHSTKTVLMKYDRLAKMKNLKATHSQSSLDLFARLAEVHSMYTRIIQINMDVFNLLVQDVANSSKSITSGLMAAANVYEQ